MGSHADALNFGVAFPVEGKSHASVTLDGKSSEGPRLSAVAELR